jgi:ankyrin repeat protein
MDPTYGTPLHAAARYGVADIVKLLLAKGANPNAVTEYLDTPLHMAAEYGQTTVAKILIAHGADVNALTKDGHTPLDFAFRGGSADAKLIESLRAAGGKEGKQVRKERRDAGEDVK